MFISWSSLVFIMENLYQNYSLSTQVAFLLSGMIGLSLLPLPGKGYQQRNCPIIFGRFYRVDLALTYETLVQQLL